MATVGYQSNGSIAIYYLLLSLKVHISLDYFGLQLGKRIRNALT